MKSAHANPPEKICRLCLSDSGVILPIFEGEVAERFSVPLPQKILSCLAINVCADDPLPPHICHRCLYEVDRFHEFRETCKRTNTTFNKICNNSGDSISFDVNQVLEIKQELHDESMYHDAISELLSDDEVADISSSRIRKRNRCISLLESMKRVQQAQTAVSANSSHSDQLPTEWMEQSKTTQANDSNVSSTLSSALECRFCAKPFVYESTLIEHEELHAKGVVTDNDSIDDVEQIGHKEHVGHEQLVPSSTPVPTRQTSTPIPILSPGPVSASAPVIATSVSDVSPPSIPSAASASSPTAEPSSAPAPVVDPIPTHTSTPPLAPTPALVPAPVPAPAPAPTPASAPALVPALALALAPAPALALSPVSAPATVPTTAPADDPVTAPATATNIVSSSISAPSSTPTPIHSLTPTSTSTSTPAHVPAPAPTLAPSSVLIPAPPSAPAHASTPTPSSVSAPTEAPTPTISASVLPNPNATSVSTAGQIIDNSMVNQEEYEAHTVPNQDNSHSQHTVDTVSLTDVTAMLLEGAFEGVRPISNAAASLCRYCQEPFSSADLLRRHERLYCNQKPSLIKHKQPLQHQQQLHIQLNSQQPPQPSVDTPLPTGGHTQHHLILHQQQSQSIGHLPAAQQPTQQADQQIIYSQRVVIEATPMEVPRSCKYCHKDFIHRGSLWRHQMFCDANPEKDLNKIVAGSKKKVVVAKSCNQRKDVQQHNTIPVVANLPNNSVGVGGTQLRRGSIHQPNSGPLKCKFCEKRFLHRGSWWRHQKMFCSVNPEIPTVKAESRVRSVQETATFTCRYCERTFLHRGSCWHHEQTHTGIKEHACRYCSKTFNEKSRLARHERMHLGIKPFSCRQCGKAFCDASNLRNHEQIHGDRASFLCAWCGKSYTRRALLLKHEQVHAREGQVFQCPLCPRTFPNPDTLNEHTMSHTQEKKRLYFCQTCGQSFRSQRLLSQHSELNHNQVHTSQQTQPAQQASIVNQVHLGQECTLHSCTTCNKSFADLSALRRHELLHSIESKPYRCSHNACNAVFHEQSQLEAHLVLHGSEKTHSITLSTSSSFQQQQDQQQQPDQHQQQLISHEIQHQHTLQQHELIHREEAYVIEGQDLSGQTIAVHHLVSQIP